MELRLLRDGLLRRGIPRPACLISGATAAVRCDGFKKGCRVEASAKGNAALARFDKRRMPSVGLGGAVPIGIVPLS